MRRLFALALLASFLLPFMLAYNALAENFSSSAKVGYPGANGGNVRGTGDYADEQTAAFRSTISVVDTKTTAGVLATTEFVLRGRQTLIVSPRFSSAGANCKIRIAYVHKTDDSYGSSSTDTSINKIKGWSDERTVTGDSTNQFEGSYYPAPDEYFSGEGAVAVRLIVTSAPSAGTCTFWMGSK